jgi:heme/copper-type cytochrome/quinol oxidase subunit 2
MDKFRKLGWVGLFVSAALLMALAPLPLPQSIPSEHTFRVAASRYEFSPAEISVNPGDRVNLELTSLDVVHGLYLDGYNLKVEADPGQTQTLSFTADRSGTFRFRCSVTCGDLHPFMIGKLHVGPNLLLWRGIGLAFLTVGSLFIFTTKTQRNSPKL